VTPPASADSLLRVIDGDSLVLKMNGHKTEIRLIGVDAPEHGQEWGDAARDFVIDFLGDEPLEVRFGKERTDRYGRTLAYVYTPNAMLNLELVRQGFALAYPVPPNLRHAELFERAQKAARKNGRGFWKQGGLRLTPREYRKLH